MICLARLSALNIVVVSFVALTNVGDACAQMCKWRDEHGTLHYAEKCPQNVEGTKLEIQAPPSQALKDEADRRYAVPGKVEAQDEAPAIEQPVSDQALEMCIEALMSLDALRGKRPVYYDQQGQLRAEAHQSVRREFNREDRHLGADARASALKRWAAVEQNNCTPEVMQSGVKKAIKQRQKAHQQGECSWWKTELEYMEHHRGFHRERTDLKTQFNAKCK